MIRTLVTTHVRPWPAVSGATIRTSETIAGLAELGPVDVVCIVGANGASLGPLDAPGVDRSVVVQRPDDASGPGDRLRWLTRSSRPWRLERDYRPLRRQVAEFLAPHYDLAWLMKAEGFVVVSSLVDCPVVTDLDDLEDRKVAGQLEIDDGSTRSRRRAREWVSGSLGELDRRRWQRLQLEIAERSAAVTVCSDLDVGRFGAPNATVVPNVYPDPGEPLGRTGVRQPPTVTMVGLFTYEPNIDGARWFVTQVLPLVRQRCPDVALRLVGRYDRRLADLAEFDGVELTGFVDDIRDELGRADVMASPLRFAGGTRVKILEAFAHRIPVVSTSVGAEGLGVVDGDQLFLADDPTLFAARLVSLLSSDGEPLRSELTERAWAHWSSKFRPASLRQAVADVGARLTA